MNKNNKITKNNKNHKSSNSQILIIILKNQIINLKILQN